jgi:hypothetical protein
MNKYILRQTLETILGYYVFTKTAGVWSRAEAAEPPGLYFSKGERLFPSFFMEGEERVPPNWDAQGLEVVLLDTPKPRVFDLVGGAQERWQTWQIRLRQWDKATSIHDALSTLTRHFGSDCNINYSQDEDGLLWDRARVTIRTKDFDLATYSVDTAIGAVPSPIEASPVKSFYNQ